LRGTLTTPEAATALGLSERQVQHLAANDQIPGARKFGRDWQFPPKPRVVRPKRGRPVTVK
jgi:excisionase family DNA binding protein